MLYEETLTYGILFCDCQKFAHAVELVVSRPDDKFLFLSGLLVFLNYDLCIVLYNVRERLFGQDFFPEIGGLNAIGINRIAGTTVYAFVKRKEPAGFAFKFRTHLDVIVIYCEVHCATFEGKYRVFWIAVFPVLLYGIHYILTCVVVLQFEGDNMRAYRLLRSIKNRFGATSELAVFEMTGKGLREVSNPSEMLTPMHGEGLSGIAVAAMLDGTRPFLIEVQSLVSSAAYGTPQRSATGFDVRRLNMLLAVLEKRAGFKLGVKDVFLNMAGGLRVSDPACDLAVICAVLSSNFDFAIPSDVCFAGEVGLSGEIRPVTQPERRIAEAGRLGFRKIYVSSFGPAVSPVNGIEVVKVADVPALCRDLFK